MSRVLVVVIACFAGVLATWLFVPAVQPAMPMLNWPSISGDQGSQPATVKTPKSNYDLMDEELRRFRAEKLIGTTLSYARKDAVYDVAWFAGQDIDIIEQAMDECRLILDAAMYERHLTALGEIAEDAAGSDQLTREAKLKPTPVQKRNCLSIYRAYGRLNGTEFDF